MKTEVQPPDRGWATPRAQVSEGGAAVGTEPRWALIHSGRVSQTHRGGVGLGRERGGVREEQRHLAGIFLEFQEAVGPWGEDT